MAVGAGIVWTASQVIGAFGGVLVNLAFRQSSMTTGTGDSAYLLFIVFYVVCLVVTWVVCLRPQARMSGVCVPPTP
ncbi:hypothetical protein [Geodermatophilus sp. DF01-2]|uniref:hypothetical protein n=1 Tax=Geodermatophilus sp. DF01-2 TaxID=2559610 RepID=UPI001FD7A4CB|nr:hypothetical protein [Geodermatophilus sp. DF01_2]